MEESLSISRNIEAKIVILGEQNVGKTSFVVVFNPDSGEESANKTSSKLERVTSTIGASFVTCRVKVKDKLVRMQVWDTAGQERFKSMAPLYYRKANAAVIMYDVSSHASFQAAKMWINELKRNVEAPLLMLLVGNKSDLSELRVVSHEQGYSYATSVGALFCETSAAFQKGVYEAFFLLATSLVAYEEEHSNFQYKFKADSAVHLQQQCDDQSDEMTSNCC